MEPAASPSTRCSSGPVAVVRRGVVGAGLCALAAVAAAASNDVPATPVVTPLLIGLGAERVRLPGDEAMDLVGGSLLFGAADEWWVGPAVYGAAGGSRGGLFVGGLQVVKRWPLAERWFVHTGLYAGGGGGASAPVGGGLMLRPEVSLMRRFGTWSAGVGWSHVRFPSGDIASSQLGVQVVWHDGFGHFVAAPGRGDATPVDRSGLGFDRLTGAATRYRIDGRNGSPSRGIGLVGARAERVDGPWRHGLEAAAAAQGDAAGYMEILGTLGVAYPVGASGATAPRVGLRAALGLGGGGAVPTGGGGLAKLAAGVEWPLSPGLTLGGEVGIVRGLAAHLRARSAQLSLAMALEGEANVPRSAPPARSPWTAVVQHYARADRVDGSRRDLQSIGLKLDRFVGEHLYLSAQAHSAFAGGAGAYSVGLVGAGLASAPSRWQFGAEALVGAAGGGGVVTGGGAIGQTLAWAGFQPDTDAGQWRVGAGAVRSRRGNLSTPLLEVGWSRTFGL